MKSENKIFLHYFFFVCIAAAIAYTFFFIFALAWQRPLGMHPFADYLFGFLLHFPVWVVALLFANLVLKIKIHRKITMLLEVLLLGLLFTPIVYAKVILYYDYLELPFYAIDFFLCLSLLSLFRRKFVRS